MATIKSYTDLEQSKVLATILPIESADMFCADVFNKKEETHSYNFHILSTWGCNTFEELKDRENKFVCFIPVWSLAALLEEIPEIINFDDDESDYALEILIENGLYYLSYGNPLEHGIIEIEPQEDFVDACYEMILKLHELKLL